MKKLLCSDCKHYQGMFIDLSHWSHICHHPDNASVVDGSPLQSADHLRYESILCGMEGLWWEDKNADCSEPQREQS
jgi:hypothetical protein